MLLIAGQAHLLNHTNPILAVRGAGSPRAYAPKGMMKGHAHQAPDRRTHRLHWNY
jgi:hypothetical protein